jgi:hypothetical protein
MQTTTHCSRTAGGCPPRCHARPAEARGRRGRRLEFRPARLRARRRRGTGRVPSGIPRHATSTLTTTGAGLLRCADAPSGHRPRVGGLPSDRVVVGHQPGHASRLGEACRSTRVSGPIDQPLLPLPHCLSGGGDAAAVGMTAPGPWAVQPRTFGLLLHVENEPDRTLPQRIAGTEPDSFRPGL